MTFDFGDVVLVPFPFTDFSATKKRPAVVVSSRRFNLERPDVVIVAVTSQVGRTSVFGEAALADWQVAGLARPSVTKPILATLEAPLVIRSLGKLGDADREALRSALGEILG